MKVLIVGAGPTGLTAAVELARLGVIPRIIDKKPHRSTLSRAVGILPNSLRLLEKSGVTEKLLQQGIKTDQFNVYRKSKLLAKISLRSGHSKYPFVLSLAQDKTEKALEESFIGYGGEVDYGRKLVELINLDNGVSVQLNDGSNEVFDIVLGADGVASRTRKTMRIDFPGFELNETWSIADVDVSLWKHPSEFSLFLLGRSQVAVVVPLEQNRYRLVSNTGDVLESLPIPIDVENIRRQATFSIAIRQVENYRSGAVFLAGDAAHSHSPVGGRGMNLGMADAAEFAKRLIDNTLDGYSASRHQHGRKAINGSERFRTIITSENKLNSSLINLGFRVINQVPALQSRLAKNILGD